MQLAYKMSVFFVKLGNADYDFYLDCDTNNQPDWTQEEMESECGYEGTSNGCLFDLDNDPCEYSNVADQYQNIKQIMENKLVGYSNIIVPDLREIYGGQPDESNPDNFGGWWDAWCTSDQFGC